MAAGPVFPGFIKIEYKTDGSSKSKFLADAAQLSGEVKKPFSEAFDSIGKMVDRVSGKLRDGDFRLDLDVSSLRAASAQADFTMQKVQALRDAAIQLATKTRDNSESTKAFVTALQAQAAQSEAAAAAARDQVTAYSNLQSAVTGLTRDNEALAQSYRDTFLEQAKVANAAYKAQQQFNALSAPYLNQSGPGRSARDSAAVFENERIAPRPKVDDRTGLEAFLAGKGAVDSAVMSVTTLESVLGRVQKKGKEVAGALAEVERAAADAAKERIAAEQAAAAASDKVKADAAAELQRLGQAADALNARLNPAVAVQQRYNNELEHARTLLKAGVIDQSLYSQAVTRAASEQTNAMRLIEAAQDQQQSSAKRGTNEAQNVINSMRSVRVAGIQAGQQIQDMAIQFQMGTNATTVFAQQVPQLAFALSGLEGNANKTLSKVGQFSTFLAGPWGAAILIAGVALVPLIDKILGTGDAADEAKGKTYDFSNGLRGLTITANEAATAFGQLSQEIRGAIAVQGDFLQSKAIAAQQATRDFTALANRENAELQALRKRATSLNPFNRLSAAETYRMGALAENQRKLRASIAESRAGEVNADIAIRQQRALERADPQLAVQNQYRRDMGALELRRRQSREREFVDPLAASTLPGHLSGDQYEGEALRLTVAKKKAEDALKPGKKGPKGADPAKEAERTARATMRLGEFSEDAGKKIANIRDSFTDIPPEVERINRATRELDDIISDLENRRPVNFEASIREAEALKAALPDAAFQQIMRQITDDAQQQLAVQTLLSQGRFAEADALRQIYQIEDRLGPLTKERKAQILATAQAQEEVNRQLERANEIQSAYLDATRSIRSEVEGILAGTGKLSNLKNVFKQLQGRILAEQLFGDVFRDLDRWVREKTGIGSSVDMMAKETERAGNAAGLMADALNSAAARISGSAMVGSASISGGWGAIGIPPLLKAPSNDNYDPNAPIVVEAPKKGASQRTVNDLTPEAYFRGVSQAFGGRFAAVLEPLLGKKLAGNLGGVLGGVFEGQVTTGTGFGAILGGLKELKFLPKGIKGALGTAFGGAQAGAQIADLGNALGLGLSSKGSQIGGALGAFSGIPGGELIGGLVGGILGKIGKILGGTKAGYSVASNGVISSGGNSKQSESSGSVANSLQAGLDTIAKAFGSSLGNYAVSIGSRSSGYVSVSASGSSKVADKNYKKSQIGKDIIYDGKDMEEALRVALRNAIEDGAIQGIRAGAKRILSAGSDINVQVEKALKFEGVFKSLRAIKDPMGAALDELNAEFKGLISIFKEAGASTAEYADLEELYGIKRVEAVKEANDRIVAGLRSLMSDLTIGDNGLSLRDRKSSALNVYNPLKARVEAGDVTAFDAYAEAARTLLDIERQLSGSTGAYFALLKEVTGISGGAIGRQDAINAASGATESPFSQLAAQNNVTASAIDSQTTALIEALGGRLDSLNDNTIAVYRQLVANGASGADTSSFTQRLAF
jgi:hypothetical protein